MPNRFIDFSALFDIIKGNETIPSKENEMINHNVLSPDLLVIGAGPGGYVASIHARKKGYRVVLVEKQSIGGTCLNVGCIPTKALIHAADRVHEIKTADQLGISVGSVEINYQKMVEQKDRIVSQLSSGISFLLQKLGVEVITGTATFQNDQQVLVTTKEETLLFEPKQIILATGAKSKHLPISGLDLPNVFDSTSILAQSHLPLSLCVIGGGVIGMEFAFLFARLGVRVQVLEFLPQILPSVDREVVLRLHRFAKQLGVQIINNAQVNAITAVQGQLQVEYVHQGINKSISSEWVLEAVGRSPNIDGLGLEHTSIQYSNKGIQANDQGQTNVPSIYAIGDVVNKWQLAHTASHQGVIAVDHMMGITHTINDKAVPSVVFTTPMIASVGLTEEQANSQQIPIRVLKTPYSAAGKSLVMNAQNGFVKLILSTQDQSVLGATIMGHDADHLIASVTLQIQNRLPFQSIQNTIFAHPTMSEIIHEAYLGIDGQAIHYLE